MAQRSRPPFRPDLEGLRGLAVLLVVGYHAGVPGLGGGFVGVDVFFVLSGFFTTRLLVREYAATGRVDVPAYYGRRALRLLPALGVMLAATLGLAWLLYAPIDRPAVAGAARAVALGNANHAFARDAIDYFGGRAARSPLLHTWSLAVEQQVSLVWPPLFAMLAGVGAWLGARAAGGAIASPSARRVDGLLRGVAPGLATVALVSLAAGAWLTRTAPSWAFFGTATRAWEFAVGGLLAVLGLASADGGAVAGHAVGHAAGHAAGPAVAARPWLVGAGLLALAAAVGLYDRATPYPGVAALLPVFAAGALVAGGQAGRGLDLAPLRWLGGVSYGWYLWHWPLVVTGAVIDRGIGAPGRLAWSAAALGLAWITRRWVEVPLRGLARPGAPTAAAEPIPDRAREGAGGSVTGAAAAVCVAAALGFALGAAGLERAAERRVGRPDQRAFAAAREDRVRHSCWTAPRAPGARAAAPPGTDPRCVFGDPRGRATVALFGDSHAEHWLAALDRLGRERGFRVVVLVMGGCPVADAPELVDRRSADWGRACADFREAAVRRIVALRPAVAVLSSYDAYVSPAPGGRATPGTVSAEAWGRGLRRTYGRLAAAGVPVVALRGTPTPGFDAPACLSRQAAGVPGAPACTYPLAGARHPAARAAQAAAAAAVAARGLPVRLVDVGDVVCAEPRCAVTRGGRVVFTDDNHLTAGFARAAAPALGARLDAALASLGTRLP